MISVILNVYRRPEMLEKQIKAILNQSVKILPENIHVWFNNPDNDNIKQKLPSNPKIKTYQCNWNTKFWGRFSIIPMLTTEYIAMFDDDIIPPVNWFKSCLETIQNPTSTGILGGSGVIINKNGDYIPNNKVGWNGIHSNLPIEVDLVGHAWFFRQEWGKYLWFEKPYDFNNGEDIMFAYLCQKYGNIKSLVPPHPNNDLSVWCTDPQIANYVGSDNNASWRKNNHLNLRNEICQYCKKNGWRTINGIHN